MIIQYILIYCFIFPQVIEYDDFFDSYEVNFMALTKDRGVFRWPCRQHLQLYHPDCRRCDGAFEPAQGVQQKLSNPICIGNNKYTFNEIDQN